MPVVSLNVTFVYTGTGVGFVTAAVERLKVADVWLSARGGTAQNRPGIRSPALMIRLMIAEACGTETCDVSVISEPPVGFRDEMLSG